MDEVKAQGLELKVPPIVVDLACAGSMWLLASLFPSWTWQLRATDVLAWALVGVGLVLLIPSAALFQRLRTSVNPMRPGNASTLVVTGFYRFTRNPMYLGFLLILAGVGTFLRNPACYLALLPFVAYMTRLQIMPEERFLEAKFGDDYSAYKRRVRRWC